MNIFLWQKFSVERRERKVVVVCARLDFVSLNILNVYEWKREKQEDIFIY